MEPSLVVFCFVFVIVDFIIVVVSVVFVVVIDAFVVVVVVCRRFQWFIGNTPWKYGTLVTLDYLFSAGEAMRNR